MWWQHCALDRCELTPVIDKNTATLHIKSHLYLLQPVNKSIKPCKCYITGCICLVVYGGRKPSYIIGCIFHVVYGVYGRRIPCYITDCICLVFLWSKDTMLYNRLLYQSCCLWWKDICYITGCSVLLFMVDDTMLYNRLYLSCCLWWKDTMWGRTWFWFYYAPTKIVYLLKQITHEVINQKKTV